MKAKDILEHFVSRTEWVPRKDNVDKIIAGNPEQEVDRCFVTWMPGLHALRTMVARGVHALICHEATFWNHQDDRPGDDEPSRQKLKYILDNKLVIIRNHDGWDRWPKVGIPWAWAQFLGLGDTPVGYGHSGYQHRYDIPPVTLDDLARHIAGRCRTIGEPYVQVTGDSRTIVSKIGIGTGCGCIIKEYAKMGCDCFVVCDDGSWYWRDIQWAEDQGYPVIRVNHATSEEPGMVTLAQYVNENLPGVRAELLPHGCIFRLVG